MVRTERSRTGQLENVGRALADLHTIGKSYKKGIDNRFSFERVADLYAEVRGRLPSYFKRIVRTLDDEVDYLQNYLESKLPKGIIHGDLFHDNIIVKGDKVVAVLDFEAACARQVHLRPGHRGQRTLLRRSATTSCAASRR